ncbi:MAG: methyltransferase [Candidatus Altiarchaeota archaeon]|nr:methyltransferase [Candidatus Altiarchaeota archaeon]
MRILFELSGEHPKLPEAELAGVLDGERLRWKLHGRDRLRSTIILDVASKDASFAGRLALTKRAVGIFSIGKDLKAIAAAVYPKIRNARSFRVRCESNTVERELGALLHERGLRVKLENPEETVEVVRFRKGWAAGLGIPLDRDFEPRHPLKRPFFHPTSLRPKTARLLLNLARVKKGDRMLDPFCGAGGILIEAGLMGLKMTGRDIDDRMIEGCGKNLAHFGVNAVLECRDALSAGKGRFDAVVTDPPYGKSSTTLGLGLQDLYERFLLSASAKIRKGGRLVMMLPGEYRLRHPDFTLLGKHRIRVHKSLTRVLWVLEKD